MKEGIRGIFLHGVMSFAAVCVTVACLLVVGFVFSIVYNANIIVNDMNKTNQVIAYIDRQYTEDGKAGTFYLHPNEAGAKKLARFWSEAIVKSIKAATK